MLVHKGGKFKNWGGECRDVTPTKLQSQNIFKEGTGGQVGGGGGQDGCERRIKDLSQGRCEQRSEVFVKIKKKKTFFFLRGGGCQVGGCSGGGGGGHRGCEQRIEVFCENSFFFFWGGGGGGGGGSGWGGQGGCE